MRWAQATSLLLQLTNAWALPVPRRMLSGASSDINVLEYDIETAYTKFELAPGSQDELTSLASPLVFEVQVDPSPDLQTSTILLNSQPLDINWIRQPDSSPSIVEPTAQQVLVPDIFGLFRSLHISLAGRLLSRAHSDDLTQSLDVRVDSVDGAQAGLSFNIVTNPTGARRLLEITPGASMQSVHFDEFKKSFMVDKKAYPVIANDSAGYDLDAYDIRSEIESLLLLEAEAGELHSAITAKKEAIAKCLKDHRDQVTLKHLLSQCDGLVCAAKVIAQRLCDKMGILTVPSVGYAKVQDSDFQTLINLNDGKPFNASASHYADRKQFNATHSGSIHSSAAIQSVRLVYPQNVLFKVLGLIATVLGLTTLFSYIRRKCMSARRKVERAADAEERRNARAYRRAARRAEMRRRWDAFVSAVNCFGSDSELRVHDYEEKRALILQDALLEQDSEAAEKGEVMEAEIRELRHAHEIVASLVRVDEHRYDLITPLHDPPPPMVPLPYTPISRSRASSATLPSYTSEPLPDYSSRYTRTEAGSVGSSSSSIRSNSIVANGFDTYMPTSSSEGETGSSSRSRSPESSNGSSRPSRYTPTSSVLETSPRPSAETLRTNSRFSRDTARSSRQWQ